MDLLVGIFMLIFFCFMGSSSLIKGDFNPTLIMQLLISGCGGIYLMYQNFSKLKEFFIVKNKEKDSNMTDKELNLSIEEKELLDYKTLIYLKKRAKEIDSAEMLELVIKMNNLLFSEQKGKKA